MTLRMKTALSFTLVGSAALILSGCATTALSPGKSVLDVQAQRDAAALNVSQPPAQFPPHPTGFAWATQTLRGTGQGRAPEGMPRAQGDVAARVSATAHARAALKQQVRALPVGSDQTVGSIMDAYITLRLAVEQEVNGARVISANPLPDGSTEATVELQMEKVASLFQKHQITPDQELPAVGERPANVPDKV